MFGEWVKMCENYMYAFLKVVTLKIIFGMKRDYESIFRFVSILFLPSL